MTESWIFDSHAHYNDPRFQEDQGSLLDSMAAHDVGLIVNVGFSLESSRECIALAETYPFIYCSVGSHPDHADEVDEACLEAYRELVRSHPKVRAIGEIGLDYHYEDIPREIQQRAFRLQMGLARELGLPVIVHSREAQEDSLRIIKEFPEVHGVFHCFSYSAEFARQLMKLGWNVGLTGVVTFKNARKAVEVARTVPLDRLLLETDCPYMAPEPFRGRRCDSTMVCRMAEKVAAVRGISEEEVCRATRENAMRMYRIEDPYR